jgi:hypothetical protein
MHEKQSFTEPYSRSQTYKIVIDKTSVTALCVSNTGNDFRGGDILSICINTITLCFIVEAPWSLLHHQSTTSDASSASLAYQAIV